MTFVLPFLLGGLFGIVASMILGYLLLRTVFLIRPSPFDTRQSFFRPSKIGSVALLPPMFFVGFVLVSRMLIDIPIDHAHLSVADQQMLWSLVLFGLLAQLFLGQRLSLVTDSGVAFGQRLVVERVLGRIHNLARDNIASIDLWSPWYHNRDRRIQFLLRDGRALRLIFGEEIRADLTTWLDQPH